MGGACREGRGEVYTGFWWGNLKVKDNLGDPEGEKILKRISKKWDRGGQGLDLSGLE